MTPSPANMYADVLRHDQCAFIHRSFLELERIPLILKRSLHGGKS